MQQSTCTQPVAANFSGDWVKHATERIASSHPGIHMGPYGSPRGARPELCRLGLMLRIASEIGPHTPPPTCAIARPSFFATPPTHERTRWTHS